MKFQLCNHGWPIGQYLVPVGTVISIPAKAGDDWSAMAVGRVPPPNAQPLDREAYYALVRAYGEKKLVMRGWEPTNEGEPR
jgi:hypothetical protein